LRRVLRWMAALAIAVVVAFLALHWLPERLAVNGPWVGLGTLGDLILGRIPAGTDEGLTQRGRVRVDPDPRELYATNNDRDFIGTTSHRANSTG